MKSELSFIKLRKTDSNSVRGRDGFKQTGQQWNYEMQIYSDLLHS